MTNSPLWITEAEVVALISLPEAVAALERILAMEAEGAAENMPKTHLMVGANNAMHALGASVAGAGLCGTKTWVNVAGKSATVVVLFGLEDGACQAVIEATALGQMRTAAMTGVGTRRLAPAGADDMAIIGTGKQARAASRACKSLSRAPQGSGPKLGLSCRCWSRTSRARVGSDCARTVTRRNFLSGTLRSPGRATIKHSCVVRVYSSYAP